MSNKAVSMAEKYHQAIQGTFEAMTLGMDSTIPAHDFLSAVQSAHMELLRKTHDALQSVLPDDHKGSFVKFLRDFADVLEESEKTGKLS